jgi:Arc/MetJ family transcription regulator
MRTMNTNLDLDPQLVDQVLALSGAGSRQAAVTEALREFVARRNQRRLLDLMGTLDWDTDYDYKRERVRGPSSMSAR